MIDEQRDDGIDNDGDWLQANDDVGLDGIADTGDQGEGDGVPTSGAGTALPGEPNIDKTDIDESDMIGLTAFNLYQPWYRIPLYDDEALWVGIMPGCLTGIPFVGNTDVLLGSGYFAMKPKKVERLSWSIIFGYGLESVETTLNSLNNLYKNDYKVSTRTAKSVTSIQQPDGYQLLQNYPNPFNSNTVIRFYIARKGLANLTIYNHLGQHVKTLYDGQIDVGEKALRWNGLNDSNIPVASGSYFYRLRTNDKVKIRRLVLLR